MADANFTQSSFLGGEWSPAAQGNTDMPEYRKAMQSCLNSVALEEGAWTRRSGTMEFGASYLGRSGIVRRFDLANNIPVGMELTYGGGASVLRFWWYNGQRIVPVHDDSRTVLVFSAATPSVMQLSSAVTWATGDVVFFNVDQTGNLNVAPQLANRQFVVTKIDTTHFSLTDMIGGASVDGAQLNAGSPGATLVYHVAQFTAPFTSLAEVQAVKPVQAENVCYFLSGSRLPYVLTLTNPGIASSTAPTFSFADAGFGNLDGPYLDPLTGASQTSNSLGSVNGGSGAIQFQCTDGAYTFTAADVGRCIRLWSQPRPYNSGGTYAGSHVVTYNGAYWQVQPGLIPGVTPLTPGINQPYYDTHTTTEYQAWQLVPHQATWSYGVITALVSGTTVALTLATPIVNYSAAGAPTGLGNGPIIDTWQLGAYSSSHYPACGTHHEGRLWLAGAYPNRFDGSQPLRIQTGQVNPTLQFSPTDTYGDVLDSSGINYTVNSPAQNTFNWMAPDHQGIVAGAIGGEWLITASATNAPLTPTSIQAHRVTKYQSNKASPLRVGNVLIFVQALGRRLIEYSADVFSGKFIGRHLNKYAKHRGSSGYLELTYQEEIAPLVWALDNSGELNACTYRRSSQFGNQEPDFTAWSFHTLGNLRTVDSICTSSTNSGALDTLCLMSKDAGGHRFIEGMAPFFDVNDALTSARFLDGHYTGGFNGVVGFDASLYGGTANGLTFYGMWYQAGATLTAFVAGLDCGDHVVQSDGSIFVAYGSDPDGLFTAAYLQSVSANYADLTTNVDLKVLGVRTRVTVPVVIGSFFTSVGQIVRPETQEQVRTQNGPGLGKTRRVHMFAAKLVNTVTSLLFGTAAANLRPQYFTQADGITKLPRTTLYSGVWWNAIDDGPSFDGMILWQIQRPYPCTVASVAGFLHTEDR